MLGCVPVRPRCPLRALLLASLSTACAQGQLAGLQADVVVPAEVQAAHVDDLPLALVVTYEGQTVAAVPLCADHPTDWVARLRQEVINLGPCLVYRIHAHLEHTVGGCEEPAGALEAGRWVVGPLDAYDAQDPGGTDLTPPVRGFDVSRGGPDSAWTCEGNLTRGSLTVAEAP